MAITLILGGTKSGKSRLAEKWASATGKPVTYIATAQPNDKEMQQRIARHQSERPIDWQTIEEPLLLANRLSEHLYSDHCVLVDCLTLWLTNLLLSEDTDALITQKNALLAQLKQYRGELIFVSNETNMGIMPLGELTRRYCDEAGLLHQQIAAVSDNVVLSIAGLPHILKGNLINQF